MALQTEVTPTLAYAQKGRAISVETTLGTDALLLESFEGEEEIACGFRYTLGLLGKDPNIDATKLIRTPATVKLNLADGSDRVINGLISRFALQEQAEGLTVYEAELRPWFWFLSLTTDFCIYQNMTVPNIVKQVCKEQGFTDIVLKCIKPHPEHEYRVQYGESHLDFISRLMEEEGIFWFAEHDGKKCNLVLADENSVAKQALALRMSTTSHETEDEAVLQSFVVRQEVKPGKFTHMDYNFEIPSRQLLNQSSGKVPQEVTEFPGGFTTSDDGHRLAHLRQQAMVAEQVEAEGVGKCRGVKVGGKIEVASHHSKSANGAYFVTSVRQSAKLGDFRSGGEPGLAYASAFTAIPFDTPYRPERTTEGPKAYGYESAVVVGPAGDEIFTDKYGRVKVQFFWDRRGKKDDKSSCWVRVSTVWAGKGWGMIATPRIGQEVLVAYINGDPEDPIIVGRVYNAEQMPPYALPANKTQSGIKTRSTLNGSPDNFNEIRFEDKKGSEELYIHAEKDKSIVVEHDRAISVGNDDAEKVGDNQTTDVGKDQTLTVGANQKITIGANRSKSVDKDEKATVTGDRIASVGGSESSSVGKDFTHSVAKNESKSIGESRSFSIGKNDDVTIAENRTTSVGKKEELSVGEKMLITVAKELVIKVGDATLTMKEDGKITLKGKDITVQGSGDVAVKADKNLSLKGSKVEAN